MAQEMGCMQPFENYRVAVGQKVFEEHIVPA